VCVCTLKGKGADIVMNFMGILSSNFVLAVNLYHLKICYQGVIDWTSWSTSNTVASYLGDAWFNLSCDKGYPDWGLSLFSSVSPVRCQGCTLIRPGPVLSCSFSVHHSVITLPSSNMFLILKTLSNKPWKITHDFESNYLCSLRFIMGSIFMEAN
jgi:hypothetical protein